MVGIGFPASPNGLAIVVARLHTTGLVDYGFGTSGTVEIYGEAGSLYTHAVKLQPDGKILVAGYEYSSQGAYPVFIRLLPNGSFDSTFAEDGIQKLDLGFTVHTAFDADLQADGKIVSVGHADGDFVLVRLLPNGALDTAFGTGGYLLTDLTGSFDNTQAMAIQPDGKIVAAGSGRLFGVDEDFALVRYFTGMSSGVKAYQQEPFSVSVYPNPMAEQATVAFTLKASDEITIRLLNSDGRVVQVFAEQVALPPGDHQWVIRPKADLLAGVYTLLVTGRKVQKAVNVSR
jgi:uncharacterized delta-60 repeat protein